MIYFELLNSIMKELSGVKNGQKELWRKGLSLYQTMDRMNTINKLSEEILNYAEQVSMSFQAAVNSSSRMLIQKAKDYIEQHYMETELSQNKVADSVGISTGYLSGLFKKETGVNFIEYLTNIRMEHAMELIRNSDKKYYEIAEETGFSNPHYFSISFKKYSKMSPSEYRNRR
ncbi:MAG TPA: helix-turn-helix transcriptional regulator [Candidatus Pelethocola excrementipullorum]|nr:helix-turn-helix transcriptional regulator [Candidatus Pelethocola excrementipullorum]